MDEDEDDAFLYGDTMAAPPPTGATTAATGAVDAQAATAVGSATTAMADGAARTTVSVDEAIYSAPLDATELPAGVAAATEVQPQVWCVLCTAQGQMRILRLPDLTEVFCSTAFGQGHTLVWDSPSRSEADTLHCTVTEAGAATGSSTMAPATDGKDQDDGASASASAASVGGVAGEIEEAVLMAVGRPATRLYLVARSRRAHIMVYEVFPSAATDSEPPSKPNPAAPVQPSTASTGRLAARLRKITHRLTRLHERDIAGQTRRFRPFADIGQCSGLFICGPRPHFLVAGHSRKAVRMHPMLLDGAVRCFAAFNHSSCPNGFVYFTVDGGLMRTAVVPPGETLSDPTLAVRRTRLPHTACAISYGPQARVFALATHEKRPARRMVRMSNDPVPPNQPDVAWRPGEVPVMEDVFRLQLLSPLDWAVVPDTTVELPIDHHITSLKVVELTTQQIGDDKRQYLAVGVSMAFGEHVTSEGYVLLYDVLTVVPEPGKPTTKNKLKEVARYEHKGAITAVDCVRGHLVVAVGQPDGAKIYVHYFRDGEELQPLAFYEASVYTALLRVIDSLVLLGDYAQGLDLLRLNEQKLHQWQMVRGREEGST